MKKINYPKTIQKPIENLIFEQMAIKGNIKGEAKTVFNTNAEMRKLVFDMYHEPWRDMVAELADDPERCHLLNTLKRMFAQSEKYEKRDPMTLMFAGFVLGVQESKKSDEPQDFEVGAVMD